MSKLLDELKYDLDFIGSHTLQPGWYKILKVFILLGVIAAYWILFGFIRTIVFLSIFLFLSLAVHFLYRIKTKKYTQSWLDFVVVEGKTRRIGRYYYAMIIINMILAVLISQLIP
jgi:Ca2+-dependent lipid-binding protein